MEKIRDNTASISLIESGVTKRSRHFSIDWFKFKDLVDNGELKVSWVPTDQNIADFFTKKLSKDKFTLFRDILMGNEALQHHFILPRAARIFAKKLRKSEVFLEVYPKLSYKGFMARTMQNIGMAKLPRY